MTVVSSVKKSDSDHCKFCGSDNLCGGEYGRDGLAVHGGTWDVICQDCGKFQIRRNTKANA